MEKRYLIILLMASVAMMDMYGQSDDFGVWSEVNVEKKINKRLSLDAGVEYRTRDDTSESDRWSLGVGAEYRLTDWLKASAGYSFIRDNNFKLNGDGDKYADYWGNRHRLNFSLTASKSIGRLGISLRERWQYTYRPEMTVTRYWAYDDEDEDRYQGEPAITKKNPTAEKTYSGKAKNLWRNRLQLKYKISKMWRPYVSTETTVGGGGLDKIRYAVGTELRLSKQHSLDVKYLFQKTYKDDDDEGNRHVLGLGYTYKF